MTSQTSYSIHLDTKFGHLEKIDINALVDACKDPWFNQTLCRVNDCVVQLGVLQGEFHWHKHDEEDEFFYVVQGRLYIDLEGHTVELLPNQGFTVPNATRLDRSMALRKSDYLAITQPRIEKIAAAAQ